MSLDYSRFANIGDSDDDEGGDRAMDFAKMLEHISGAEISDELEAAPPVPATSERPLGASSLPMLVAGAASQEALGRCVQLMKGAEPGPGEDSFEVIAAARATLLSELEASPGPMEDEEPAWRCLVEAVIVGLQRQPKCVAFARENAPEFVGVLLSAAAVADALTFQGAQVPVAFAEAVARCDLALSLLSEKCRPQEVYTFVLEALHTDDLCVEAQFRAVILLSKTMLAMEVGKYFKFLGSCMPYVLKKLFGSDVNLNLHFLKRLEVARDFAVPFHKRSVEASEDQGSVNKVVQSMVSAFLFKVLQRSYAAATGVQTLSLVADSLELSSDKVRTLDMPKRRRDAESSTISVRFTQATQASLPALCSLAATAAFTSPRPIQQLLEEIDVGDACGDGGGDLEVSPLSLAVYVCLLELHNCWQLLLPYVIPMALSCAQRANILVRAAWVLISNTGLPQSVVSLSDLGSGAIGDDGRIQADNASGISRSGDPRWVHRGLALLSQGAVPLLRVAALQTPNAYSSLSGLLCRWYPQRAFQTFFEALVSSPDLEREVRGALFFTVMQGVRVFEWPCRFELYLGIIQKCRVDSVIGAIVTSFKDDWWPRVLDSVERGESLAQERVRVVKVFAATLSGEIKVVDGMDTLTAALNIARLVALHRGPAGTFLREALIKGGGGGAAQSLDFDAMLARVSAQIDTELALLANQSNPGDGDGLAAELQRQLLKASGGGDGKGSLDMRAMQQDRITMVAHLVARVRELLSAVPPMPT